MTREHKLAMIVGFALVLVVGVLVSDHLSGARKARMANVDVANDVALSASSVDVAFGKAPKPAPKPVLATSRTAAPTVTRGEPPADAELPTEAAPMIAAAPGTDPEAEPATEAESVEQVAMAPAEPVEAGRARDLRALGLEEINPPATVQLDTVTRDRLVRMGVRPDNIETTDAPTQTVGEPAVATAQDRAKARKYTIRDGDTLWSIAADEYGDGKLHAKLAEFNKDRLGPRGQLREGASILLPEKAVLTGEARRVTPAPVRERLADGRTQTEPTARPGKTTGKRGSYTVKPGDTLEGIARRELGSARRWEEILNLNSSQLDDETSLRVGMTLKLPNA